MHYKNLSFAARELVTATYPSVNKLLSPFSGGCEVLYKREIKTTSFRQANLEQFTTYKRPPTNSFITFFRTFQSCTVPKKREKHYEIDFHKVNKVLVETQIDPAKESVERSSNKYYDSIDFIFGERE